MTRKHAAGPKRTLSLEALEARTVPVLLTSLFPNRPSAEFPTIQLPPGYQVERVVGGLTFATSTTWDDQGRMYVAEAGGGFLEEPPPAQILRVEGGRVTGVIDLGPTVGASLVGMTFANGAFYVSHRDPTDGSGAVSRVTLDGTVTRLLSGLPDSRSEHQVNDIRFGPDGRLYLATGPATNSAVVGLDNAPFVGAFPDVRAVPARDYVLTGVNFETPDFRTANVETDVVRTGAFVSFGTPTAPGQVIPGSNKGGGTILVFDAGNAEGTVRPFADGFRNIIGLTWNSRGELFAAVNGYDNRGSRPVNDQFDATYRVRAGEWYGWPDFSANLEPLTDPKFAPPARLQAPAFLNGERLPPDRIAALIDLAASGLSAPDRSLVAGLHRFSSSPSLLDAAPAAWGRLADQLFIAEWGDLAPATNPLLGGPAGFLVSRLNPATGQVQPFVRNFRPGAASEQQAAGLGLERPFDVKFGPDGAMYIVDYGTVRVNPADAGPGDDPYEFPPETGAVWRVARVARTPGADATPDRAYVAQLYRDLLGREPALAEVTAWSDLLEAGTATRGAVVAGVLGSAEFRANTVRGLYAQLLGRDAEAGGLAFWVGRLEQGSTVEQVAAGIIGSAEYFAVRGGGTADGFLQAVYTDVLFRALDEGGAAFFREALNGQTREAVASAILTSREADVQEVRTLFFGLLGRDAAAEEQAFFVEPLQRGGASEQAAALLLASDEYAANADRGV